MDKFYIKVRNNLLPHPINYIKLSNSLAKLDFRISFWGKAMDFIGEPGNQLPFSF
jgi:hypothetical protein